MGVRNFTVISGGKSAPVKNKAKPRDLAIEHLEAALATGVRGQLRDAIQDALDVATAPKQKHLSELQYAELKPGRELLDAQRPGFLARRTRSGVRLMYRHNDPETEQRVELVIGYMRDISLAEARKVWERLREQRLRGEKPVMDPEDSKDALTMVELADIYIKEYCQKHKKSWKEDSRLLNRHILPNYGSLRVDDFTYEKIAALFASLADRPRELGKLRASLLTMFNVAVGKTRKAVFVKTWLPRDFANPVAGVQIAEHKPTVHQPTTGEIQTYAAKLSEAGLRQDYEEALKLQLLAASRIQEVTGMRWDEVDLDNGEWTLPPERSKNGQQHLVLMSDDVRAILDSRYSWKSGEDEYVFPAPSDRTKPMRSDLLQNTLAANRKALGLSDKFTSHNVRHAFTTWAAEHDYIGRCGQPLY